MQAAENVTVRLTAHAGSWTICPFTKARLVEQCYLKRRIDWRMNGNESGTRRARIHFVHMHIRKLYVIFNAETEASKIESFRRHQSTNNIKDTTRRIPIVA